MATLPQWIQRKLNSIRFRKIGLIKVHTFGTNESIWTYPEDQSPFISFLNQRLIDENNVFIELFGTNKAIVKEGEKKVKEMLNICLSDQENIIMHVTDCISIINHNDLLVKQVVDAKTNLNNILNTMFFVHIDEEPYQYDEYHHNRKMELIDKSGPELKSVFFLLVQKRTGIIADFFQPLSTT